MAPRLPMAKALPAALLWQTALNTSDRISQKSDVLFGPDFVFNGPEVLIGQEPISAANAAIVGFGGAFTESAALVLQRLSPEQRERVLQGYFGPDGLGYTLGRVHINSCDFSTGNYAFDDVDNDHDLTHFDMNVSRDSEALIPFIRDAQDILKSQGKALKLFGTPWSPPAWMKSNNQMDNSNRPCLKSGMEATWASYMAKWVSAYKAKDIPLWGITMQNEPENNASWDACLFTAEEGAEFIASHLGPTMRDQHPDVLIFAFDHNKDHVYEWATTTYNSPAKEYVAGIAYHWYSGDSFEAVRHVHESFPQAVLLPSEATYERYRWHPGATLATGEWSFGEGYAHDIIGDLNAGSVGWTDWNLILDENGGPNHVNNVCDAAMQANLTSSELYFHPQYYYIGHFSKFILPGSKLLPSTAWPYTGYQGQGRGYGTCTKEDGLQVTSFLRPDGKVAAVALNCDDAPITFKLRDSGLAARVEIPPRGIQTYLIERAGSVEVVV